MSTFLLPDSRALEEHNWKTHTPHKGLLQVALALSLASAAARYSVQPITASFDIACLLFTWGLLSLVEPCTSTSQFICADFFISTHILLPTSDCIFSEQGRLMLGLSDQLGLVLGTRGERE